MNIRSSFIAAIATLISATWAGTAQAIFAPIPGLPGFQFEVTTDTPQDLLLRLRGGAVTFDTFVNNFRPPAVNWDINFDIALSAFLGTVGEPIDEQLAFFGEIFHKLHPPGEGLDGTDGFPFTPSIVWGPSDFGNRALIAHPQHPPGHHDDYTVNASCDLCGVGFVGTWQITLTGSHHPIAIPEPAALGVLGVGFLALLGYGWRHRMPAGSGREL